MDVFNSVLLQHCSLCRLLLASVFLFAVVVMVLSACISVFRSRMFEVERNHTMENRRLQSQAHSPLQTGRGVPHYRYVVDIG